MGHRIRVGLVELVGRLGRLCIYIHSQGTPIVSPWRKQKINKKEDGARQRPLTTSFVYACSLYCDVIDPMDEIPTIGSEQGSRVEVALAPGGDLLEPPGRRLKEICPRGN